MKKIFSVLFVLGSLFSSFGQNVGIGTTTPDASAALDITASDKGLLIPRVNLLSVTDAVTIPNPAKGLVVFHNNKLTLDGEGFYINLGTAGSPSWVRLTTSSDVWSRFGNNVNSVFAQIGTLDNFPLNFVVNNLRSGQLHPNGDVLFGLGAGSALTHTKPKHIAIGRRAMGNALQVDEGAIAIGDSAMFNNGLGASNPVHGINNIAIGTNTLVSNTIGNRNVAIGHTNLRQNSSGFSNTSIGALNLTENTLGAENTALGAYTMQANQTGSVNIAIGNFTMNSNVSGSYNIALGKHALYANTTKDNLLAIGDSALFNNGVGASNVVHSNNNVAIGNLSLFGNTTGYDNTAVGYHSGYGNTIGRGNTALGSYALNGIGVGSFNVAIGINALLSNSTGFANVAIGVSALGGTTGGGNVGIGNSAGYSETGSDKLYIENSGATKDNALIYGDFANDSLLLNAKTIIRNQLTVKQSGDLTGIELGYLTAKQTDAGKIQYGGFGGAANVLNIVGGGTAALGNDRAIKLWSEGGLRIRGAALPDFDNFYPLGTSTLRWSQVWAASGVVSSSDANLKTNITASPYGLQEVLQMNPVQYNWKTNPTADLQIGFLAQDMQKLIPEAVVVPRNGDPMGMKYTELIPVLVKGMQEQQALIIALQKTNEALQKRLEKLESKK